MLYAALSLGAHAVAGVAYYALARRILLQRPLARRAAAIAAVLAHGLAFGSATAATPPWGRATAKSTVFFAAGMCLMSRLTVLGVTGGIACGKSMFGLHLKQRHGAVVIDCDVISREVRCLAPAARRAQAPGRSTAPRRSRRGIHPVPPAHGAPGRPLRGPRPWDGSGPP